MDMTQTIAPKSDQLNADDLISGPVTVTIAEVVKGTFEQPVDIRLVEYPGRAYRPSKSMRRVMVEAWGVDGSSYATNRLTLIRNPDIMFGPNKVGGIEIAAMTGITKPLTVALTAKRGQRKNFTVQPLAAIVQRDWAADITRAGKDVASLRELGNAAIAANAGPDIIGRIRAAVTAAGEGQP